MRRRLKPVKFNVKDLNKNLSLTDVVSLRQQVYGIMGLAGRNFGSDQYILDAGTHEISKGQHRKSVPSDLVSPLVIKHFASRPPEVTLTVWFIYTNRGTTIVFKPQVTETIVYNRGRKVSHEFGHDVTLTNPEDLFAVRCDYTFALDAVADAITTGKRDPFTFTGDSFIDVTRTWYGNPGV